jgi:hypothetical protein
VSAILGPLQGFLLSRIRELILAIERGARSCTQANLDLLAAPATDMPAGDNARVGSDVPCWSSDVDQAGWIAQRLAPREDEYAITIVVPARFEAYARVLHPAETPDDGDRLVRWADVAAWSGMPLRKDAQFHSIALPPAAPGGPPPYSSQGPQAGSLYMPDAEVLAAVLRDRTATPQDCWFCVWAGFGWDTTWTQALTDTGRPPEIQQPREPVPGPVRAGPRVHLPDRDYFLYQGPAQADVTLASLDGTWGQCPNIWWPAGRAWCVASEIDLPWTYVGGPRGLIDAILADDRIETPPATPDDPVSRVEGWVTAWAGQLAHGLMTRGTASLGTPRGSVDAWLRRLHQTCYAELGIQVAGPNGSGRSLRPGLRGDDLELRREVHNHLTFALLDLTGM